MRQRTLAVVLALCLGSLAVPAGNPPGSPAADSGTMEAVAGGPPERNAPGGGAMDVGKKEAPATHASGTAPIGKTNIEKAVEKSPEARPSLVKKAARRLAGGLAVVGYLFSFVAEP